MVKERFRKLGRGIWLPLRKPTLKQKEAYCRWLHTLSAACVVGAVTIAFATNPVDNYWAKLQALIGWGVVLFFAGAFIGKGE